MEETLTCEKCGLQQKNPQDVFITVLGKNEIQPGLSKDHKICFKCFCSLDTLWRQIVDDFLRIK